ncbi:hypothetical protein AAG570_011445, partial [Ranatra chinensis]
SDEREDVQKKTFAKWINSQLTKVKLVNISSNDIVDGNPKLILGLVWSIIQHWQVHSHLKELMTDMEQTNLEKTLLLWCRKNTQNYAGVDIRNFTTSWSDGLAFNALLHRFRPELFDFELISKRTPAARLEHAFKFAQLQLNIERLLDPEDVNTSVPDKKSIMMYVMCLFQSLPHSSSPLPFTVILFSFQAELLGNGGGSEVDSRPVSIATNVSVELGGYQVALEEVLTWLLEAEDRLNLDEQVASSLEDVKRQFHNHESFISELYRHREGVGAVLEEGVRMLTEGGLSRDEEEEVRLQMRLLNSRWETLRINAIQKQSKIYDAVMTLQDREVESLRQWMTSTEDRISRMGSEVGPDSDSLRTQLHSHSELQEDIKRQQAVVDSLSHFVVVVDENSAETHSQIEDQLSALAERWAHICQWAQERGGRLQSALGRLNRIETELSALETWARDQEAALKRMEARPTSEIGEILERIKHLQVLNIRRPSRKTTCGLPLT